MIHRWYSKELKNNFVKTSRTKLKKKLKKIVGKTAIFCQSKPKEKRISLASALFFIIDTVNLKFLHIVNDACNVICIESNLEDILTNDDLLIAILNVKNKFFGL